MFVKAGSDPNAGFIHKSVVRQARVDHQQTLAYRARQKSNPQAVKGQEQGSKLSKNQINSPMVKTHSRQGKNTGNSENAKNWMLQLRQYFAMWVHLCVTFIVHLIG